MAYLISQINNQISLYIKEKSITIVMMTLSILFCSYANAQEIEINELPYAINAGGQALTDSNGIVYEGDPIDKPYFPSAAINDLNKNPLPSQDWPLYQTERFNKSLFYRYRLPENGLYKVTLKFAEIYHKEAGKRLFHVKAQGKMRIGPMDIFQLADGDLIAYDREIIVEVIDNNLELELTSGVSGVDKAKLSALVIEKYEAQSSSKQYAYAINSGGDYYLDDNDTPDLTSDDVAFSADNYYEGGKPYAKFSTIADPLNDQYLYQSERFGNFSYKLALESGSYEVTLKFAEIYHKDVGKRIFSVLAESVIVEELKDFDIFAASGANTAHDVSFTTMVKDGELNLEFILGDSGKDNAKLGALLVRPVEDSSGGVDVPTEPEGAVIPVRQLGSWNNTADFGEVNKRLNLDTQKSFIKLRKDPGYTLTARAKMYKHENVKTLFSGFAKELFSIKGGLNSVLKIGGNSRLAPNTDLTGYFCEVSLNDLDAEIFDENYHTFTVRAGDNKTDYFIDGQLACSIDHVYEADLDGVGGAWSSEGNAFTFGEFIDDIRIYTSALTDDQISLFSQNDYPKGVASLEAHWDFEGISHCDRLKDKVKSYQFRCNDENSRSVDIQLVPEITFLKSYRSKDLESFGDEKPLSWLDKSCNEGSGQVSPAKTDGALIEELSLPVHRNSSPRDFASSNPHDILVSDNYNFAATRDNNHNFTIFEKNGDCFIVAKGKDGNPNSEKTWVHGQEEEKISKRRLFLKFSHDNGIESNKVVTLSYAATTIHEIEPNLSLSRFNDDPVMKTFFYVALSDSGDLELKEELRCFDVDDAIDQFLLRNLDNQTATAYFPMRSISQEFLAIPYKNELKIYKERPSACYDLIDTYELQSSENEAKIIMETQGDFAFIKFGYLSFDSVSRIGEEAGYFLGFLSNEGELSIQPNKPGGACKDKRKVGSLSSLTKPKLMKDEALASQSALRSETEGYIACFDEELKFSIYKNDSSSIPLHSFHDADVIFSVENSAFDQSNDVTSTIDDETIELEVFNYSSSLIDVDTKEVVGLLFDAGFYVNVEVDSVDNSPTENNNLSQRVTSIIYTERIFEESVNNPSRDTQIALTLDEKGHLNMLASLEGSLPQVVWSTDDGLGDDDDYGSFDRRLELVDYDRAIDACPDDRFYSLGFDLTAQECLSLGGLIDEIHRLVNGEDEPLPVTFTKYLTGELVELSCAETVDLIFDDGDLFVGLTEYPEPEQYIYQLCGPVDDYGVISYHKSADSTGDNFDPDAQLVIYQEDGLYGNSCNNYPESQSDNFSANERCRSRDYRLEAPDVRMIPGTEAVTIPNSLLIPEDYSVSICIIAKDSSGLDDIDRWKDRKCSSFSISQGNVSETFQSILGEASITGYELESVQINYLDHESPQGIRNKEVAAMTGSILTRLCSPPKALMDDLNENDPQLAIALEIAIEYGDFFSPGYMRILNTPKYWKYWPHCPLNSLHQQFINLDLDIADWWEEVSSTFSPSNDCTAFASDHPGDPSCVLKNASGGSGNNIWVWADEETRIRAFHSNRLKNATCLDKSKADKKCYKGYPNASSIEVVSRHETLYKPIDGYPFDFKDEAFLVNVGKDLGTRLTVSLNCPAVDSKRECLRAGNYFVTPIKCEDASTGIRQEVSCLNFQSLINPTISSRYVMVSPRIANPEESRSDGLVWIDHFEFLEDINRILPAVKNGDSFYAVNSCTAVHDPNVFNDSLTLQAVLDDVYNPSLSKKDLYNKYYTYRCTVPPHDLANMLIDPDHGWGAFAYHLGVEIAEFALMVAAFEVGVGTVLAGVLDGIIKEAIETETKLILRAYETGELQLSNTSLKVINSLTESSLFKTPTAALSRVIFAAQNLSMLAGVGEQFENCNTSECFAKLGINQLMGLVGLRQDSIDFYDESFTFLSPGVVKPSTNGASASNALAVEAAGHATPYTPFFERAAKRVFEFFDPERTEPIAERERPTEEELVEKREEDLTCPRK